MKYTAEIFTKMNKYQPGLESGLILSKISIYNYCIIRHTLKHFFSNY